MIATWGLIGVLLFVALHGLSRCQAFDEPAFGGSFELCVVSSEASSLRDEGVDCSFDVCGVEGLISEGGDGFSPLRSVPGLKLEPCGCDL